MRALGTALLYAWAAWMQGDPASLAAGLRYWRGEGERKMGVPGWRVRGGAVVSLESLAGEFRLEVWLAPGAAVALDLAAAEAAVLGDVLEDVAAEPIISVAAEWPLSRSSR